MAKGLPARQFIAWKKRNNTMQTIEDKAQQHLVLISPPALKGHTNERTYSGGIGVSRKLKPFEKDSVIVPPIDMLYTAAIAEENGAKANIVDLLLDRFWGAE